MRLLHTKGLYFEEFFDSDIPEYAILSHRWGEKEVSFQQWTEGKPPKGQGLSKIEECCRLAAERGLSWVWIDTCCIDKKSSAELSEAINSMYKWYSDAKECYAFLSDVNWSRGAGNNRKEEKIQEPWKSLRESAWFTRGWTLQELLAPRRVLFYDHRWKRIGDRDGFKELMSDVTGIAQKYLIDTGKIEQASIACASIAMRMSWMSKRRTSRREDVAYCLMGLFDVNMPLLYGEGEKAFYRLQLEIMKTSDDESIFAWRAPERHTFPSSMLAPAPIAFAGSRDMMELPLEFQIERPPYSMTNKGLALSVPYTYSELSQEDMIDLVLNCGVMRFEGEDRLFKGTLPSQRV